MIFFFFWVVDNVLKLFFSFWNFVSQNQKEKKKIVARIGIGGPSLDIELVNLSSFNLLEELEGVEEFELDQTSQTKSN